MVEVVNSLDDLDISILQYKNKGLVWQGDSSQKLGGALAKFLKSLSIRTMQ